DAPGGETSAGASQTVEAPTVIKPTAARPRQAPTEETTREMPRLKSSPPPRKPEPPKTPAPPKAAPAAKSAPAQAKPASKGSPPAAVLEAKIIADAVRLLKWGKPWHELAELIARIADRPPAAEIRKLLRSHRAEIEGKAAGAR